MPTTTTGERKFLAALLLDSDLELDNETAVYIAALAAKHFTSTNGAAPKPAPEQPEGDARKPYRHLTLSKAEIKRRVAEAKDNGVSRHDFVTAICQETGVSRSGVYRALGLAVGTRKAGGW